MWEWPHNEHYISISVRVTSPRTLRQCRLTEPLDLLHRDSHRTHRHPALCQGSEEVGGGGVTTSANSTRIFMCNFVTSEFNLSRVSRLRFGFERRRLCSVFLFNFIREILNINWVIRLFRINDGNILLWYVNLLGLGRGTLGPQLEKWIRLLHTFEHGMHYYSRVRVWFIIVLEKLKDFSNVPMLVPVIVSMVTILLTYHEWKRWYQHVYTRRVGWFCLMGCYYLPLYCFSWPWLQEIWTIWLQIIQNFRTRTKTEHYKS